MTRNVRNDLADLSHEKTYGVVAANMLMNPLIEYAAPISRAVSSGGYLLMAGMLVHQYETVLNHYPSPEFKEIRIIEDGEWKSCLLQKKLA